MILEQVKGFFHKLFIYDYKLIPLVSFVSIYPLLFGVLIRLPDLIKRWRTQNRFDWARFLIIVLPGIIIITQTIISVIFGTQFSFKFMFDSDSVARPLIGIWVGAQLADSIKGKTQNNNYHEVKSDT